MNSRSNYLSLESFGKCPLVYALYYVAACEFNEIAGNKKEKKPLNFKESKCVLAEH